MTTNTTQVSSNQQTDTDSVSQDYGINVGSFSDQYKNVNLVLQTLQWIKEDEQKLVNPKLSIIDKYVIYQDLSNFFQGIGKYTAFAHSSADAAMRSTVQSAVKKSLEEFNNLRIPVPSDKSQGPSTAQILYNGRTATLADIILNWNSDSQSFSFKFRKNINNESSGHDNRWSNQCQWEKDFGFMNNFAELVPDVVDSGNGTCHKCASGKVYDGKNTNENGIKVSAHHGGTICHPQTYETLTVSMSAEKIAKYMTVQPPETAYPGASLTAPLDNALFDLGL
jgi:hypothetical protein